MDFMADNNSLVIAKFPELQEIGWAFLEECETIKEIYMPNLQKFKKEYLKSASNLQILQIPDDIVNVFAYSNQTLKRCLKGSNFFKKNKKAKEKQLTLIRSNKI